MKMAISTAAGLVLLGVTVAGCSVQVPPPPPPAPAQPVVQPKAAPAAKAPDPLAILKASTLVDEFKATHNDSRAIDPEKEGFFFELKAAEVDSGMADMQIHEATGLKLSVRSGEHAIYPVALLSDKMSNGVVKTADFGDILVTNGGQDAGMHQDKSDLEHGQVLQTLGSRDGASSVVVLPAENAHIVMSDSELKKIHAFIDAKKRDAKK